MEALAKHDFSATADDELSFRKGHSLLVLSKEDDQNWFKAESEGRIGYIPNNYIEMKKHDWFYGKMTRVDAERKLLKRTASGEEQPDGAFLVRGSESSPGEFSLSVKFRNVVQHFKVLRDNSRGFFLWVVKFNSLNELIDYHRTASVSRSETILLKDMISDEKKVVCAYDFRPEDESELPFSKGETIVVLDDQDQNWWRGINQATNREGLFPASYVKQVK